MKVYVSELPKDCIDCPCESEYYCNLLNEDVGCLKWGEIHKDCPLQSLTEHDKQVRKELIGDLKEELKRNGRCSIRKIGIIDFLIEMDKLNEILEEFKGEQNGSKN